MSRTRIFTVLIVLYVFATAEIKSSATSIANFWISQHGVPSVGSEPPSTVDGIPQINRLTGSGTGSFYIWAKPGEDVNLVNWSLDVVSTNPSAITLTNSWVAPYNQSLNGIASGEDSERRWEYFEQPTAGSPDKIKDINGFSLFGDDGDGIGIGPVNDGKSPPDPYYHSGSGSWLIARIDYLVGTAPIPNPNPILPPESEIYLQIGSRGMSHCPDAPCFVSSTSDTKVVFGLATDPPLNAGSSPGQPEQRGMPSATADAKFMVASAVAAKADFDGDGLINGRDLTIWKETYGLGSDGDADGDGDTDGRDFFAWQRQFSGSTSSPGDFDGDGDVDGRDFLVRQRNPSLGNLADWQEYYGQNPLTAGIDIAVPEPATILLIFPLLVMLYTARCKAILRSSR